MLRKLFPWSLLLVTLAAVILLTRTANGSELPKAPDAPPKSPEPVEPALGSAGLRAIAVEAVSVVIGQGSPIPVETVISGTWPDLCAQLALVEQNLEGIRLNISLLASPLDPDCPPYFVGLPFRLAIPLNMAEVGPATYIVVANTVGTSFEWTGTAPQASASADLPSATFAYLGTDGNVWVLDTQTGLPLPITGDANLGSLVESEPGMVVSY